VQQLGLSTKKLYQVFSVGSTRSNEVLCELALRKRCQAIDFMEQASYLEALSRSNDQENHCILLAPKHPFSQWQREVLGRAHRIIPFDTIGTA
jgi:fido (protein-threonine AMPylation protein)